MKTVATFNNAEEAHLLRMRLEAAGIEVFVQDENVVQSYNPLGGVRVQVADEDEETVRRLLAADTGGTAFETEPAEKDDFAPDQARRVSPLHVGLILLLAGIPILFALFHFHSFLNFVQNEGGGESLAAKNARIQLNNAAANLVNRGIAKQKAGDPDGALADYQQALKLNPDDSYACVNRGRLEVAKGNADGALADFNKAIQLKPDDARLYVARGIVKKQKRDLDAAIADYGKAIQLTPDDAEAYAFRGIAKKTKGDADGAIADYDKAIDLKPDYYETYVERAIAKRLKGDLIGAIADCYKAIQLQPDNSGAYVERGIVKRAKGDWDGAMADYDKAINLKPDDAIAYSDRGHLKMLRDDLDGAMIDCNKAVELKPNSSVPYESRGSVKKAKGNFAGALADYDKAIELNKNPSWSAFHYRGCLRYDMREFPEALVDFRKASALDPPSISDTDYPHFRIYLVRALLNENSGATEELRAYLSGRKAGPQDEWVLKIGRFLTDQLAEADFINAAVDPDEMKAKGKQCEAWFYAGTKHLIAGGKETARDDFKKCIATGQTGYFEYASAAANLKFLGAQ